MFLLPLFFKFKLNRMKLNLRFLILEVARNLHQPSEEDKPR